jgi:hypothetical protein
VKANGNFDNESPPQEHEVRTAEEPVGASKPVRDPLWYNSVASATSSDGSYKIDTLGPLGGGVGIFADSPPGKK